VGRGVVSASLTFSVPRAVPRRADDLTVIEASIVPNGLSGFTHIPTVMLAERLSEQIAAGL
jgi:hypothetical protein